MSRIQILTAALTVVLTSILVSCSRTAEHSIVNVKRLIVPANENLGEAVAGLKFRATFILETHGEPVLVTDPIYLGDIYNAKDEEKAVYVREHGVLLVDFGGDTGGPVWWQAPYLLMPISTHYKDGQPQLKKGVAVLAEEVACDSGSFVFLPVTSEMPSSLQRRIQEVVEKRNGALLRLPEGKYSFFYEQFDAPQPNMVSLYRNIVARKD